MERESFENPEIARLLNERFVSIKVDREERPDVDGIYMLVCQMMAGQGGWPLSVFLTPDKVPFYAGTYFPKESRFGMPGFKDVIISLSEQYQKNPEKVKRATDAVQKALQSTLVKKGRGQLGIQVIHSAFKLFEDSFDPQYGGFGDAPKFPMPHSLSFLLMYYKYFGNEQALNMAIKTLEGLCRGGIYDHIGFGFSRYSVDPKFLVPHFEKMLYDNALLAIAYTEAYQITGKEKYREIAEEILTYCLRDIEHPEGGFYSAEDADSEGEEGKFYLWSKEEVIFLLGEETGELFCRVYDISEEGNFEGKNIPNLVSEDLETFAKRRGMDPDALKKKLDMARKTLFLEREKRVRPFKDDKILLSWNGLMIAALAICGRIMGKKEFLVAAEKAFRFIESHLFINGRAMVRFREGEVKEKAFLDDYAFYLWGLMELYNGTGKTHYLNRAKGLADMMIDLFWDEKNGGFYFTGSDQETLLFRQKQSYDGALPSGNSVAAMQLLKLGKVTGNFTLEEKAEKIFQVFSQDIEGYPQGHTMMLMAFMMSRHPMKEVVILQGEEEDPEMTEAIRRLRTGYHPGLTWIIGKKEELEKVSDFIRDFRTIGGKTTLFLCENFQCQSPVTDGKLAIKLMEMR